MTVSELPGAPREADPFQPVPTPKPQNHTPAPKREKRDICPTGSPVQEITHTSRIVKSASKKLRPPTGSGALLPSGEVAGMYLSRHNSMEPGVVPGTSPTLHLAAWRRPPFKLSHPTQLTLQSRSPCGARAEPVYACRSRVQTRPCLSCCGQRAQGVSA